MPFTTKDIDCETISATAPTGVDDAVGVPDVKWFVAIVNSRHEKAVRDKLLEMSIRSYVATQQELRVWNNGRRKLVDRVVIPSVVFVNCTEKQRRDIVALPYINRFMVNRSATSGGLNRPVAVISDAEIDKLRFMLGQTERPVEFAPTTFRVNDNVRVIRGNLRGLEGEIRKNSDGTHTLIVSLALLGGATVYIDPHDVEKIKP
ncbi:MAG: UpxY family transcription antiterminator [Muribaculaceae bacterium]|nr:UpxY family transcription antiterminator [Muribaculaceae bacterium]